MRTWGKKRSFKREILLFTYIISVDRKGDFHGKPGKKAVLVSKLDCNYCTICWVELLQSKIYQRLQP